MKKFLALLLSAALLPGLCACAAPAEGETDYSGQTLAGKITALSGSTFRGTLSGSTIALTVEEGSTLILTGDSTAASLEGSGTIQLNGYTLTLADGTVLR